MAPAACFPGGTFDPKNRPELVTSIRLTEHESEGHNEELIALVVANVQDPVTPILEAALAG
ncbi:hypothetical protein SAMN05216338_105014 [Bradyrhizobium sp. Rc2d]|nr:hypothetical protein SAMN05216338_105014 [Bradyrhizobium sp. Rc2d]